MIGVARSWNAPAQPNEISTLSNFHPFISSFTLHGNQFFIVYCISAQKCADLIFDDLKLELIFIKFRNVSLSHDRSRIPKKSHVIIIFSTFPNFVTFANIRSKKNVYWLDWLATINRRLTKCDRSGCMLLGWSVLACDILRFTSIMNLHSELCNENKCNKWWFGRTAFNYEVLARTSPKKLHNTFRIEKLNLCRTLNELSLSCRWDQEYSKVVWMILTINYACYCIVSISLRRSFFFVLIRPERKETFEKNEKIYR